MMIEIKRFPPSKKLLFCFRLCSFFTGMLTTASKIAREAGGLLREHFGEVQLVKQASHHDIKLQIDMDCQRLIAQRILAAFPDHSIIGEEESHGDPASEYRWVVDPLDGTVNYTHGIPHCCVSIALQKRAGTAAAEELVSILEGYENVVGVVFDPMRNELFSAEKGRGAFLNGRPIRVSSRDQIEESILCVGFSKTEATIERGLCYHQILVRRARKLRAMGSAALDLAYVAAGRIEAYLEFKISLWDIAAGILLVQEAGGKVELRSIGEGQYSFETLATNGKLDLKSVTSLL